MKDEVKMAISRITHYLVISYNTETELHVNENFQRGQRQQVIDYSVPIYLGQKKPLELVSILAFDSLGNQERMVLFWREEENAWDLIFWNYPG